MNAYDLERAYKHERYILAEDILTGKTTQSLRDWARNTPGWMDILHDNDVALFPDELDWLKEINTELIELTYHEDLESEIQIVNPDVWRSVEYFIADVGKTAFNELLHYLGVDCPEFMLNDAAKLVSNPHAFDDVLMEAVL